MGLSSLPPRDYRTVFLDAGGTLLRPHPSQEEVTAEALASLGVRVDAARLRDAMRVVNVRLFGAHGRNASRWATESAIRRVWMEYYEQLCGLLGVAWSERVGAAVYERFGDAASWALYDDALPAVRELAARGLVLGIVSDWGTSLVEILHATGLSAHLSFAVVSAYAGAAKPDRDVFQYALSRARAVAEQAIHVGDVYVSDVLGARGAGIEPVLIDRDGRASGVDCVVVRSLAEIARLVDDARAGAATAG